MNNINNDIMKLQKATKSIRKKAAFNLQWKFSYSENTLYFLCRSNCH